MRKGVYPYSYIDCYTKFTENCLPDYGRAWENILSGEIDVSKSDADFAKRVWTTFKCNTVGDYHDLYLRSDVILLAAIFESFRKLFKDIYDLDPCHYYSSPNISWDAMLKTTGVELELLSDIDMLLFCEKAVRGGLNGVGEKRYFKANNQYLQDYDEEKPSNYGLFLDIMNLYGGTMMKNCQLEISCGLRRVCRIF